MVSWNKNNKKIYNSMKNKDAVKQPNFAFVDTQNVNLSIRGQWWRLDWKKFRIYLSEKYFVSNVYLFIWYLQKNKDMYDALQSYWYTLVFKEVLELKSGEVKWNVDAELVLQSMIDYPKYGKALVVTWDWDFSCLIKYLYEQNKLEKLLVPNSKKYSKFLRKAGKDRMDFMTNLREKLKYRGPKRKIVAQENLEQKDIIKTKISPQKPQKQVIDKKNWNIKKKSSWIEHQHSIPHTPIVITAGQYKKKFSKVK